MIKLCFNGQEPGKSINPDTVVAYGDEIGEPGDVLSIYRTPLSLGTETAGGIMTKLVKRNKTIPRKANETFTTW